MKFLLYLLFLCLPALAFAEDSKLPKYKTVIAKKGIYSSNLDVKDEDLEDFMLRDCPNKICEYDVDVDYINIIPYNTRSNAIEAINAVLKNNADQAVKKAEDYRLSRYKSQKTYLSENIISITVDEYHYHRLDGGCEGGLYGYSFNLKSGKKYLVKDIVDSSKINAFVISKINEKTQDSINGNDSIVNGMNNISDSDFLMFGFYIKDAKVYLSTKESPISCLEGNFATGELPKEFITDKDILKELK